MGRPRKHPLPVSAAPETVELTPVDLPSRDSSTEPTHVFTEKAAVGSTVTFVGDPRGGKDPDAPEYGGMAFPKGKAVKVSAEWLKANDKISKNSHFKVE